MERSRAVAARNEDVLASLKNVEFITPEMVMLRVDGGTLTCRLSHTAKLQLGAIFGVRWDKWFTEPKIDAARIMEELARRMNSDVEIDWERLVRLRRIDPSIVNPWQGCSHVVRGILSKSYSTIDDPRILDLLTSALQGNLLGTDVRIMSTPWRDQDCDSPTNLTFLINHPIVIPHNGRDDVYFPGVHFSNSEVGARAVNIEDALVRVICVNGMIRVVQQRSLVYQIHRRIDDDDIQEKLVTAAGEIRASLPVIENRLKAAHTRQYTQPDFDKQVEDFILNAGMPKKFAEQVKNAFLSEPELTRFGLIQAITLAAQDLKPEEAYLVERAASKLLIAA
jgi:hypothetical protein